MRKQQLVLTAIVGAAALLAWWALSAGARAQEEEHPEPHAPRLQSNSPGERGSGTFEGPWDTVRVEPRLLRQMLDADPGTQHRAIVELISQAELETIPAQLGREERRSETVRRLRATAHEAQARLLEFLLAEQQQGHVAQYNAFWVFNGIAVTADSDTLLALAALPEVRLIRSDRWRLWLDPPPDHLSLTSSAQTDSGVEWNIARIEADAAWENLGLDGSGLTVAIMDTGVDWQHPALQAQYRGYRPGGPVIHEGNWSCTTDEAYLYPVDGHGHGTHVAGLAVGGRDDQGIGIGVAPGARWIAVKMLSDDGYGYDSWIHAAFEWLLAPADDPSLAPDIVNGSWGSPLSGDETFRDDVQAVRAAGIVPVFSAGNEGPQAASLDSPGSYPEATTVGATDDLDQVASFSSRGPSPWGEIKPEVCAPGTQVRSSLPGGTYGVYSGTSMAAPHVAGTAALVLQADSELTVDAVEAILAASARPTGQYVPNNDCGWGRIHAYLAAATALDAGYLTGQVTGQADQMPLPGAEVTAFDHEGQQVATARADEEGVYWVALAAGQYDLEFTAFGHAPHTVPHVWVQSAITLTLDVKLAALPHGVLWGYVTSAGDGEPVAAELSILDTPRLTVSDAETGIYSFTLPAGTYSMTARRNGYRLFSVPDVTIQVDQQKQLDVDLIPAPTLLLLDSGPWYYGSQAQFFEQALTDLDYAFDLWEIRDRDTDVPSDEQLSSYDITLWSAPFDSPGLVGASEIISSYLTAGGNLLLTGQDVGYWDGGLEGGIEGYYRDLLMARAIVDDAGRDPVVGLAGELLSGLTLPMNGPDSAGNQMFPDAIEVADPRHASLLGEYTNGYGVCLRAAGCQSYQAVYFAAGLEALGDRLSRAEVVDRVIDWLSSSQPVVGLEIFPSSQSHVWLQSQWVTYTVEIANRGVYTDRFSLDLSQASWPSELLDGTFVKPITQTDFLGKCQTQTLGVRVTVPPGVVWNTADTATLTARSQADPSVVATASLHSKAPAPILIVDDHRWYDTLASYESALQTNDLPFDVWTTDPTSSPDAESISARRLQRYPIVIWFTAYDWYSTLTASDEGHLQDYLDMGGRLLLSSQDYLFTNGLTRLAAHYMGIAGYTESLTATQIVGSAAGPAGAAFGPYGLSYPFRNWSDALQATHRALPVLWGQHGQPVALSVDHPPWKAVFAAVPLEALGPTQRSELLGRLAAWLSPLGDSTITPDRPVAMPGEEVAYSLSVRNSGPVELGEVTLLNAVPVSTTYVPGSLQGPATYDPAENRITWAGSLESLESITISYRLSLDDDLGGGALVSNAAHLVDESGLRVVQTSAVLVDSPDLSASVKRVQTASAMAKQTLTYTLLLRNDGLRPAPAELVDPTPVWTSLTPGTGWASSGDLEMTPDRLLWTGSIWPGQCVTVTFSTVISPNVMDLYILNRATLDDGSGVIYPLEVTTWVENRRYLPLVYRSR